MPPWPSAAPPDFEERLAALEGPWRCRRPTAEGPRGGAKVGPGGWGWFPHPSLATQRLGRWRSFQLPGLVLLSSRWGGRPRGVAGPSVWARPFKLFCFLNFGGVVAALLSPRVAPRPPGTSLRPAFQMLWSHEPGGCRDPFGGRGDQR